MRATFLRVHKVHPGLKVSRGLPVDHRGRRDQLGHPVLKVCRVFKDRKALKGRQGWVTSR